MRGVATLRVAVAGAGITLVSACGFGHRMELAVPAASHCPAEPTRVGDTPPDTMSLRWYRSSDDRDVRLSSAWCETVGEEAVELDPTVGSGPWVQGRGLTVASWNMEVGGGDLLGFLRDEVGYSCEGGTAQGGRPFVVLLQEAWRFSESLPEVDGSAVIPWTIDPDRARPGAPDVVQTARQCGLALVYVPSARNGPDDESRPSEDMGTAILSSVPLTTPIAMQLPHEGGRKVAVAATIEAPGGQRVRVVSVHLDVASTLVRTLLSGNQTRARQASGLIEAVDQAERDGPLTQIVIVGGDFNTWASGETALKLMHEAFPDSPEWDGEPTRGSFPPDHIFFRRRSFTTFAVEGYTRIDDPFGSDHQGRKLVLRYGS